MKIVRQFKLISYEYMSIYLWRLKKRHVFVVLLFWNYDKNIGEVLTCLLCSLVLRNMENTGI